MATNTECKQFISEIAPLIQQEAKIRGYKVCSPIIAQACIESGYGKSKLAAKYHNYFGMKCGSKWTGPSVNLSTKEEYTVGTLTTIKDNFRVYTTMAEGVSGYFDFISSSRYSNLKSAITPKQYLEFIKADGYATSSTYVNTNMNCIKKWSLDKFDSIIYPEDLFSGENPYKLTKSPLRRGMRGDYVSWLQFELNRNGFNIVIDGIFGKNTEQAVKEYQKQHGLVVDGVVGVKTIKELSK